MANTVYTVEEVALQDESLVTLKPANIKVMRKGQELISKLGEAEDEDQGINRLLDIVCLCLKRQRPEFEKQEEVENADGSKTSKTVTDYELMEELFDLDTVFKVIEVYLGIKLNDPKLLEVGARIQEMEQAEKEKLERDSANSTSQKSKQKSSS